MWAKPQRRPPALAQVHVDHALAQPHEPRRAAWIRPVVEHLGIRDEQNMCVRIARGHRLDWSGQQLAVARCVRTHTLRLWVYGDVWPGALGYMVEECAELEPEYCHYPDSAQEVHQARARPLEMGKTDGGHGKTSAAPWGCK